MKVLILLFLSMELLLGCTNKREYCYSRLKAGPDIQGIDSLGSCASYLAIENQISEKTERGENVARDKRFSDGFLILCVQKTIQEKNCANQSEYIPHFGY